MKILIGQDISREKAVGDRDEGDFGPAESRPVISRPKGSEPHERKG